MSANSVPCTVWVDAWETPAPKRAQKNKKMFVASPERNTMTPKKNVAIPMIGARRKRSASQPMGTMPSTKNAPEMPATKTITPELTWNEDRMFGASTLRPELCRLSRATMTASTAKVEAPNLRKPSRREVCSSRVPRKEVLGEHRLIGVLPRGPLLLFGRVGDQPGQLCGVLAP